MARKKKGVKKVVQKVLDKTDLLKEKTIIQMKI